MSDTEWPVEVGIGVQWGEMDAFGHVNNTVYLRWFETARMEMFIRLGVLQRMANEQVGPILASTRCDFLLPVQYPDQVKARATISKVGNTSFVMDYEVFSEAHQAVAARGNGVLVMMDYTTNDKVPHSDALREALAAHMGPGSV